MNHVPPAVMRILNEQTEVCSHMDDLRQYMEAVAATATEAEATLLNAQAKVMCLYANLLSARLSLATGIPLPK